MKEDFKNEKRSAIEQELKEYQSIAKEALEKQKHLYDEKIETVNANWEAKLAASKNELTKKLSEEFAQEMQLKERAIEARKNSEINELKNLFEKQLKLKEAEFQSKLDSYKVLNAQFDAMTKENNILKERIGELRAEFQTCIQRFSKLRKEESDFLFPLDIN